MRKLIDGDVLDTGETAQSCRGSEEQAALDQERGPSGEPLDVPAMATTRRNFLKYTLTSSATLVVGGALLAPGESEASISIPELGEVFDDADLLKLAESPYTLNLVLEVTHDNRVRFELPRLEKGQGIATALAMLVADELDADYDRTDVVLNDRPSDRPLSITGGSTTMRTLRDPVRTLAAWARARLVAAAASRFGVNPAKLTVSQSRITAPDGRSATYGELSHEASNVVLRDRIQPKAIGEYPGIRTRATPTSTRSCPTTSAGVGRTRGSDPRSRRPPAA